MFYRRRSDVPLGGPRFKQILQDFDNPPEQPIPSEDEVSESGEDQGLVGNSSLRGSSSPLTGAGAVRHQQNLGLGRAIGPAVNPALLESLPDYQAHELDGDAAPMSADDVNMNDGLHASIEEDEGIDMEMNTDSGFQSYPNYNPLYNNNNWSFNNLELDSLGANSRGNMPSGTGSDDGLASDIVEDNSSASAESREGRLADFDNAIAEGEDHGEYLDAALEVPDMDDEQQAAVASLQMDILDSRFIPEVEEPAAEIHLDDKDEIKLC